MKSHGDADVEMRIELTDLAELFVGSLHAKEYLDEQCEYIHESLNTLRLEDLPKLAKHFLDKGRGLGEKKDVQFAGEILKIYEKYKK